MKTNHTIANKLQITSSLIVNLRIFFGFSSRASLALYVTHNHATWLGAAVNHI